MSLQTHPAPSQAVRCGDRNHRANIARQHQHASANPHQQAEAIAAIVRKRIADGQSVPDLDRYRLDNATWAELLDVLTADELSAVGDAAGADDFDDSDDEPTPDDITRAFEGDVPFTPEPPVQDVRVAVAHVPSWRDHEPPIVHSLKWLDADGIEHLHVVRADDLDEALRHVMKVKVYIKAAHLKAQKACDTAQTFTPDTRPDWCHVHDVAMKQRGDESKEYWYSHKAADGSWCRGRKAKA